MFVYGPHGQASDSEDTETESDLPPEELLLVNVLFVCRLLHLLHFCILLNNFS